MTRSDNVLYTGQTSASFASGKDQELKEKREQSRQERLELRNQLKPIAEPVLEALDVERDQTITRLLSMVGPGTPNADVKNLLISLNLYRDSMTKLKAKLQIILKDAA